MSVKEDIPQFTEHIFSNKSSKYILVIPVLNEGNKIRKQLLNIKNIKLNIDIVIVDGGSDDGSLEHTFLKSNNIRALLIKNDNGRLSAQLRIAYSWSLLQGYGGIITIDGNGKDNVNFIDQMIIKLDEGFDYVQGSRYAKGGISMNTPLDRVLGNRVIHAPLLSLVSGFRFTDTTNGFRAYSKAYLAHPKVQPFREIFMNYEFSTGY